MFFVFFSYLELMALLTLVVYFAVLVFFARVKIWSLFQKFFFCSSGKKIAKIICLIFCLRDENNFYNFFFIQSKTFCHLQLDELRTTIS